MSSYFCFIEQNTIFSLHNQKREVYRKIPSVSSRFTESQIGQYELQ